MNLLKKGSLFIKIGLIVAIIATIGVLGEAAISSLRISHTLENSSKETLSGVVTSKSETIREYADQQFKLLDAYCLEGSMAKVIENNSDSQAQAEAIAYTQNLAATMKNFDSMLYMNYEGVCLVHNMPEMVGYQNDEETRTMIQQVYFQNPPTPQYAMTAVASPATNSVTLLFMKSFYKKNEDPAGYVALALNMNRINDLLSNIDLSKNQEVTVASVNAMDGSSTAIFDLDPSLISTTIESGPIPELATKLSAGDGTPNEGSISYTSEKSGKEMIGSYVFLPEYSWLLFVATDKASLNAQANAASGQIWIIAIIVLVIIVAVTLVVLKLFLKPLTDVQQTLSSVADYHLNVGSEIERYKEGTDEIGKLANATSDVITMLKDAVGVLRTSSDSLNSNSENLDNTSRKLVDVSTENTAITQHFSAGREQTSNAIDLVEEEITKIVQLVDEVGNKVKHGEQSSEDLIANAKKMNETVNSNIEANVQTMDETVATMQDAMNSLAAVEKINELADAIMDITSQTNLLSLNASIEAARAGEAGRGFAVVAGEIGQLAEQSKNTAMNIQQIVEASNHAVENVKVQVNKLIDYMKGDVTGTYKDFAEQSQEYSVGIGTIKDTVQEIGDAMKSLGDSVNQIAKEINAVTGASKENSDGVSDIIRKNEETSQITVDIEKLAESNRNDADKLVGIVKKFKI
ncbi:MAG: methyl-accepting chemotaxis protein [Lachnospiraceae bacterium]|nr:methyl-accepting chemotaxis protein [Lachnospiraceae bacterium]